MPQSSHEYQKIRELVARARSGHSAYEVAGSASCSCTPGTPRTTTTSGGRCCAGSTSGSSSRPAARIGTFQWLCPRTSSSTVSTPWSCIWPDPIRVWRALAERPRALLTVVADYVYVPAAINTDAGDDPSLGVPTSYYAAVQAEVDVEIVDDPVAKAAILARQIGHFEPEGSTRVTPGVDVESDRRLMPGIRGMRLTIIGVNAKFKFGGNKTQEHRAEIAAALQSRGGPMDASAARYVLTRAGETPR